MAEISEFIWSVRKGSSTIAMRTVGFDMEVANKNRGP